MKKFQILVTLACIFGQLSCSLSPADLYVSVNGDDDNPGTKEMPFRTLVKAQVSARELQDKERNVNIWLNKGSYSLDETLIFGPEDSGAGKGSVSFRGIPGENVEISGGKEIKNWEKRSDGIWVAPYRADNTNSGIRELFIDDIRGIRARHPNKGFLRIAQAGSDRRTNFHYHDRDFPLPEDPSEVELVLLHDWSITRTGVKDIDEIRKIITAKDTIGATSLDFFTIDNWEKNPRYFLENSPAFMDYENEFYYSKKDGLIYLKLKQGESPNGKRIMIPVVLNNLIRFEGTEDNKVKNIHFENIAFSYCSWSLPYGRYAGIQACHFEPGGNEENMWNAVPAAIMAVNCESCSFINCTFTHLGGSGIWLGTAATGCLISGCRFEDISGNGIMIGEGNDRITDGDVWWKKYPGQAASGNTIENSVIKECGKQFFGAVGIWCGITANTSILNNHIFELPYTGISIGWVWNPTPTPCRENRIEGNHIHHVMQILSDGGGIYSLGLQPGSSIVNNHIHDIPLNTGKAESNGMFLDEGTTNLEIRKNIIYNIARSPLRFHKATINTVRNNVLACSDNNPPVRFNNTPVENIIMEDNQILQQSDPEHLKILNIAISKWSPEEGL